MAPASPSTPFKAAPVRPTAPRVGPSVTPPAALISRAAAVEIPVPSTAKVSTPRPSPVPGQASTGAVRVSLAPPPLPLAIPAAAPLPGFAASIAAPLELCKPVLSSEAAVRLGEAQTIPAPPLAALVDAAVLPRTRNPSFTWEDLRISPDPIAREKMKPEAQIRRAKLAKYVKVIVCGCAALCLVALVRSAVASESDTGTKGGASGHTVAGGARQKVIARKLIVAQTEDVVKQARVLHAPKRARR